MAAVEPIRLGVEVDRPGIVAKPVAKALLAVDQWDVLLIVGLVLLVLGVGLQWGLPLALIVGGALLALCGLYGARNTTAVVESD